MKNYREIFESGNDSAAVEQNFYLVRESGRGQWTDPQGTDFIYHLPGGGITVEQPVESSSQRSGRHHRSPRKRRQSISWSLKSNAHIKTDGSLDQALATLLTSAFGSYDHEARSFSTASAPDLTFSFIECGDAWAKQAAGSFVMDLNINLPADGEAELEFTGNSKDALIVGIVRCSLANVGTEGKPVRFSLDPDQSLSRIPVGSRVMIIKSDGYTRSADTIKNSRKVLRHEISGDSKAVILDGVPLTSDSDGSLDNPVYLCYFEPSDQNATDNPLLGLTGKIVVQNYNQTIKSMTIKISQNHKLENDVFGTNGLGGGLYQAVNRVTVENTISANLNGVMLGMINDIREVNSNHITAILGDTDEAHVSIVTPRVYYNIPNFTLPDEGEVPLELNGTCYETPGMADEITLRFMSPQVRGHAFSHEFESDEIDDKLLNRPKKRKD